jgi:hypothetical protein
MNLKIKKLYKKGVFAEALITAAQAVMFRHCGWEADYMFFEYPKSRIDGVSAKMRREIEKTEWDETTSRLFAKKSMACAMCKCAAFHVIQEKCSEPLSQENWTALFSNPKWNNELSVVRGLAITAFGAKESSSNEVLFRPHVSNAISILEHLWAAVEALAVKLITEKSLTGKQVEKVLRKHWNAEVPPGVNWNEV